MCTKGGGRARRNSLCSYVSPVFSYVLCVLCATTIHDPLNPNALHIPLDLYRVAHTGARGHITNTVCDPIGGMRTTCSCKGSCSHRKGGHWEDKWLFSLRRALLLLWQSSGRQWGHCEPVGGVTNCWAQSSHRVRTLGLVLSQPQNNSGILWGSDGCRPGKEDEPTDHKQGLGQI